MNRGFRARDGRLNDFLGVTAREKEDFLHQYTRARNDFIDITREGEK